MGALTKTVLYLLALVSYLAAFGSDIPEMVAYLALANSFLALAKTSEMGDKAGECSG